MRGQLDRSTSDLIQLILTVTIGICLVAGVVGTIVVRLVEPGADVGTAASSLGSLLSALAGYVIGSRRREDQSAPPS
jgi:hypothetical protein